MRPPGDRYQEPPRDRGGPWDTESRREREHPRDRNRPPHESRDRERKPRGELSPGRGPKQWEERKGGRFWFIVLFVDGLRRSIELLAHAKHACPMQLHDEIEVALNWRHNVSHDGP